MAMAFGHGGPGGPPPGFFVIAPDEGRDARKKAFPGSRASCPNSMEWSFRVQPQLEAVLYKNFQNLYSVVYRDDSKSDFLTLG